MPRKAPPQPINISSPITRPANALTLESPRATGSGPSTPRSRRSNVTPKGGRRGRRNGTDPFADDYATASPTHDYLEAFNSYPSSPDPLHSPIPISPTVASQLNSPRSPNPEDGVRVNEKGDIDTAEFGSGRLLKPSTYPSRTTRSGKTEDMGARQGYSDAEYVKFNRGCVPANPTKRRWLFFGLPIALVIIAGIAIGAAVGVSKSNQNATGGSDSSKGSGNGSNGNRTAVGGTNVSSNWGVKGSGENGSTVVMQEGGSFVYTNEFGGSWSVDPYDPYSVSGKAQSWSPSLLEEWQWGTHIIRGVNLGGWLVTEPFIVPSLYEQYQKSMPRAVDEYTLCQAIGPRRLAETMEEHYKTFITEEDFAEIAAAGLNWVRIPLGYWAIETTSDEPYLPGVSWTYFLKAIDWARKYGLRILLDFHALPGSQNGWNHSGKSGAVNWMYGVMGIANAQRHLEQIRSMTEFISQPGIKEVVPMISLVNEVQATIVGKDVMAAFYHQAYEMIRGITGFGAGNGPIIALHEGFLGVAEWSNLLQGGDRVALDQHPYLAFGEPNNNPLDVSIKTACGWGGGTNDSSTNFGITIGGEWSNAVNNCGKWLTGVGSIPSYVQSGMGTCDSWEDWANWTQERKDGIAGYALANMDALQNWFFWTWRIGNSTEAGYPTSPMWHYRLGLQQGWMPKDPRVAGGYCGRVAQIGGNQFSGTYPASATGGVASPTIAAAQVSSYGAWPPTSIGPSFTASQVALFPTLTQTGTRRVLPTQGHPANVTVGSGWANPSDTVGAWVRVQGCGYPNEYNATAVAALPTGLCAGTKAKRDMLEPRVTHLTGN